MDNCPICGSEDIHTIGEWWECENCDWTETIENVTSDLDKKWMAMESTVEDGGE